MPARLALRRDADQVVSTLGRAFIDDPVMRWLAGHDDDRRARVTLERAMFTAAARAAARTGQGYVLDDPSTPGALSTVALWNPPDTGFFDRADGERIAAGLAEHATPGGVARLQALAGAMHEVAFPAPSYFHLQFIGVAPDHRSRGLGAVAMAPVLQRCDLDGLPAALESSNPRNVSFYRRLGFEVVWEAAPDGGPPLQGMWRPARTA